jgi:hypothetical protein
MVLFDYHLLDSGLSDRIRSTPLWGRC